jgi:hypothetical protein
MTSTASLETLPTELLYRIFSLLNRPRKIALALSAPYFTHAFAAYYDLDRYDNKPDFQERFAVPEGGTWKDTRAQGAILRYICMDGGDDMDAGDQGEDEEHEPWVEPEQQSAFEMFNPFEDDAPLDPPYEHTQMGREDALVNEIFDKWLDSKFGIEQGCVLCAGCQKFIVRSVRGGEDRGESAWVKFMSGRPA